MPQQQDVVTKQAYNRRAQGDRFTYLSLGFIYGTLIFFLFYFALNLMEMSIGIAMFFSVDFWKQVLLLTLVGLLSDYAGKLLAYGTIKAAYRRPTKSFLEQNQGLNLRTFSVHLLEAFLRGIAFLVGAVAILQQQLFIEITIITFILVYLLVKIVIHVIAKLIVTTYL